MRIALLDCTLRDGGYINKWAFKQSHITKILRALLDSKVEVIECGYLSNKGLERDSTLFRDIASIDRLLDSVISSDAIESKPIDSERVCAPRFNNGGASGDLLSTSGSNLPQENLVYKKGVSPSGVDEVATPKRDLDSEKSAVCSRSGASGDLLSTSGSNLPQANCNKTMFVAMINLGDFSLSHLKPAQDSHITGLRLAFHKEHLSEALTQAKILQDLGYKVFFQPMVTKRYSDIEFLTMLESLNALRPHAFYIVDSFGSMTLREFGRYLLLSDSNLDSQIALGYHSHNNMQLAFANAINLTQSNLKREVILDASIYGIGRGAGNLNTELIADFLNKEMAKHYHITPLLEVIDSLLESLMARHSWGFSPAQYLSASLEIHPNYANFLTRKNNTHIATIQKVLQKIPESSRSNFDKELIEKLYIDTLLESKLKARGALLSDKKFLLLAPGASVLEHSQCIESAIKMQEHITIAINHKAEFVCDYYFFANQKRYDEFASTLPCEKIIITNNIKTTKSPSIVLEYRDLVFIDGEFFTNATVLLLHYLARQGVESVEIAGLDGYRVGEQNYAYDECDIQAYDEAMREQNSILQRALRKLKGRIDFSFLTPSIFEECV